MARLLFWNIDALRPRPDDGRKLPELLAALAREHHPEIILLAERPPSLLDIYDSLLTVASYSIIESHPRFAVFTAFSRSLVHRFVLPAPNGHIDIFHVSQPAQHDFTLALTHGLDKRNNDPDKQEMFFAKLMSDITWIERALGHTRTAVVGDFNANPFESSIGGVRGMHAVIDADVASAGPREVFGSEYEFFYNPSWALFGNRGRKSAPGSYYYAGGQAHELYWHVLDQVLIRPALIPMFKHDQLQLLTSAGDTPLLTRRGIPSRATASDHLPLFFELDLRYQTQQNGDSNA